MRPRDVVHVSQAIFSSSCLVPSRRHRHRSASRRLALVVPLLLMVVTVRVVDVAVKEKSLKFEVVLSSFQTPDHMTYLSSFFFRSVLIIPYN